MQSTAPSSALFFLPTLFCLSVNLLAGLVVGEDFRTHPDFRVELVYRVPADQGSWVSLANEKDGRLVASDQYGKLYRITPPANSTDSAIVEPIHMNIGFAHGLLYAFDSLFVVSHGGPDQSPGLYRLQDTNEDGGYDSVKLLRKFDGTGEHGPHAVIPGPDGKSLYVCGGNHTKLPDPESSRLPRCWAEDQLLPRMWDAGGHAVGILAPGGWICKTDPDGREFELISAGYRNHYDIAFDSRGELFTYDADMEWDVGTAWYRPTRICHATSGSEFGWRSGTGKWPTYFHDSLPAVVDIGPGSPTGIAFGTGAKFPEKFQRALLIADWSYGIIYAVHLTPNGSSFRGDAELLCSAPALQVADLVVRPDDGNLYFVVGGRKTDSALYRISYAGSDSVAAAPPLPLTPAQQKRRQLENLHYSGAEQAVAIAWPELGNADRFVRFAARVAIEHQGVDSWIERLTTETRPAAVIEAVTALARTGGEPYRKTAMEALSRVSWEQLSRQQRLYLLRTYSLIIIRMGAPADETADELMEQIRARFASRFPSDDAFLNRELCRLLIATGEPTAVPKTMELLADARTQEEQLHYVLCLSSAHQDWANHGWNDELRRRYFDWFVDAANLSGGQSMAGFIKNIRDLAVAGLDDSAKARLKETLARRPEVRDPYAELKSRPFVKQWTVDELLPVAESGLVDRNYANGRKMFSIGQCYKCHRFGGEGGIAGPDLTAIGRRYNMRNLLQTLIDPNREISDQYQATNFELADGRIVQGRVVNLNRNQYIVQTDMLKPAELTHITREEIEEMSPSKISLMPERLLDHMNRDDILDLLAFLRSGGDSQHPELFGGGDSAGEK